MAGMDLIPSSTALDSLSDPGARIILSCERAKAWLAEALASDQIEQIVELKSQAEAIRVYTVQKQLGHDAELSAAEIVRRAERCIGLAIRKGQAEGRIAKRGDIGAFQGDRGVARISSVLGTDTASAHDMSHVAYRVTDDVSEGQFESALEQAKGEKNLSRANVVRKLSGNRWGRLSELAADGHNADQIAKIIGVTRKTVTAKAAERGIDIPAERIVGRTKRLDQNRILREFVATLESLIPSCELIEPASIKPAVLSECVEILGDSIKALRKLERRLKGN